MTKNNDQARLPLRRETVVIEFLTIFVPLAVLLSVGFLLYHNADAKLRFSTIKNEERFYVEMAKNNINQNLEFLASDILVLAQNDKLDRLLENDTTANREALSKTFLTIAKDRRFYDQIRYLDINGMEIARVNFNSGSPMIVADYQLQNKADRYYFMKTLKLEQGELYMSPFDLNKEHGQIETPLKPVLRVGTSVFDRSGTKKGVLILNYLGNRLISGFDDSLSRSAGDAMFLNAEGYWFRSPNRDDEWGFMSANERSFAKDNPAVWEELVRTQDGQLENSSGLFTFATIHPGARVFHTSNGSPGGNEQNGDTMWKILTFVPPLELGIGKPWHDDTLQDILFFLLLVLLAMGSGFVANARTNKKMAEASLRASEERYRHIAEISSDWVWEMDSDLRFSHVSSAFEKLTGVSPADQISKTSEEMTSPEELLKPHWQQHLKDLQNHRKFKNFLFRFTGPDGIDRHFSLSGSPVFDTAGRFIGYRGTGADVTDLVEAENLLKITKERAEKANRAKSDFLANMSHELRTPLNSIIGFSQMLKDETFGSVGGSHNREYVDIINTAGAHLHRLIGDILDISKIEAGEYELTTDMIDVHSMSNECESMLEERANKKQVSLRSEIPEGFPKLVGDELKIKQVILNLLSNAIKFTPEGGNIRLAASLDGRDRIKLKVIDTGIGIAEEDIPQVTNPFEQTGNVLTRQQEGTGLGLALAKSLTELHDGKLSIESRVNEGTTIIISFPTSRTALIP